jgi:hypothetical protein
MQPLVPRFHCMNSLENSHFPTNCSGGVEGRAPSCRTSVRCAGSCRVSHQQGTTHARDDSRTGQISGRSRTHIVDASDPAVNMPRKLKGPKDCQSLGPWSSKGEPKSKEGCGDRMHARDHAPQNKKIRSENSVHAHCTTYSYGPKIFGGYSFFSLFFSLALASDQLSV